MARLVFGMNQSLYGYVDQMAFAPSPALFRHFVTEAEGQTGSIYGRGIYEIMRYWEQDRPEWGVDEQAFAAAWRRQRKWVASRDGVALGPDAEPVTGDLETAIRAIKEGQEGEIEVAGPVFAQSLTALGLIDEYRIYLHPVVLGRGQPYFAGPRTPLRLLSSARMAGDVLRLCYVPV